jgi:hypothetical protein
MVGCARICSRWCRHHQIYAAQWCAHPPLADVAALRRPPPPPPPLPPPAVLCPDNNTHLWGEIQRLRRILADIQAGDMKACEMPAPGCQGSNCSQHVLVITIEVNSFWESRGSQQLSGGSTAASSCRRAQQKPETHGLWLTADRCMCSVVPAQQSGDIPCTCAMCCVTMCCALHGRSSANTCCAPKQLDQAFSPFTPVTPGRASVYVCPSLTPVPLCRMVPFPLPHRSPHPSHPHPPQMPRGVPPGTLPGTPCACSWPGGSCARWRWSRR